jgi:hypothetical protein
MLSSKGIHFFFITKVINKKEAVYTFETASFVYPALIFTFILITDSGATVCLCYFCTFSKTPCLEQIPAENLQLVILATM